MASRTALYLMPSMAVLATAALVLGPGRERPAVGARIWGIPAGGTREAAWRLETMERQFGSDQAIAVDRLELSISQRDRSLGAWRGRSEDDGVAEALVTAPEPLRGFVDVRVARDKALLAQGSISLHPVVAPFPTAKIVDGKAEGDVKLVVEIERGVLAAPFPGVVRVSATGPDGMPVPRVRLRAVFQGAEGVEPGAMDLRATEDGIRRIAIVPTAHAVDLRIEAFASDGPTDKPSGTWEGGLPVHPGAMWIGLRQGAQDLEVRSPVPRDRVYASMLGTEGRIHGAVVPLAKDDKGFSVGVLQIPPEVGPRLLGITIAGDPQEKGSGTVTWPVDAGVGLERAARVELLLDGMPFAEQREHQRAGRARLVSVGVAFLAAVFEAVLLVLYSRAAQAKLTAHLAMASADDDERAAAARMTAGPASRAFTLVALIGLVVLGFGAVAAFAVVR